MQKEGEEQLTPLSAATVGGLVSAEGVIDQLVPLYISISGPPDDDPTAAQNEAVGQLTDDKESLLVGETSGLGTIVQLASSDEA